jgi:vacuolar protein sorting-associated protein 13A/C
LPYSIGRVSEVFNNAPEYLTRQEVKDHHQKNPKTVFSGVGYGAWSFVKGIGTGLSGIVVEPYKGAKERGVKGATIGVGKGIIGLVAKPVAGTFGLV